MAFIPQKNKKYEPSRSSFVEDVQEDLPADDSFKADDTDGYSDNRMWSVSNGFYIPCDQAIEKLPSGSFIVGMRQDGTVLFKERQSESDDLILLPDSASEEVIDNIKTFWTKEDHFRKFGFLWKRGVLLWGPPGSGKTATIQLLTQYIIEQDGITVFLDNPDITAEGLRLLRRIEPNRKIIVIMEDLDAIIIKYGESGILALLDGELQIDNIVFVATTNYPENLDARVKNRPSRFDIVKEIPMPNAAARKAYLLSIDNDLASDSEELEKWVEDTKGLSIAHIKELMISVRVFDTPYDEVLDRMRTMAHNVTSNDSDSKVKAGFVP